MGSSKHKRSTSGSAADSYKDHGSASSQLIKPNISSGRKTAEREVEGKSLRKSFSRSRERKSSTGQKDDGFEAIQLDDFRDLIEDDEDADEVPQVEPSGFPKRVRSYSNGQPKSDKGLIHTGSLQNKPAAATLPRTAFSSTGTTAGNAPAEKPLPRLLAPRVSISASVEASYASATTLPRPPQSQPPAPEAAPEADAEDGSDMEPDARSPSQTMLLRESVSGAKKKRHSTMGHMWKVVRKGMQLPKQAAAELQAISVSAAKQAGDVMTVVRDKVQEDVQAMQDHLLGGKRNLPDHPARPTRAAAAKPRSNFPPPPTLPSYTLDTRPTSQELQAGSSSTPYSGASGAAGAQQGGNAVSNLQTQVKNSNGVTASGSATISQRPSTQPSSSKPSEEGVERSKGSAYMLSKYDEPESPSRGIADVLVKTADALNLGKQMVMNPSYLRRLLACGMAGRSK